MIEIKETIAAMKGLDREAMDACRFRLDNLIKPMGSLGALEDLAVKIAGVTGNPRPGHLKKSLIILAADHGIVKKSSAYSQKAPSSAYMMFNIVKGFAPVNSFAKHVGADLVLADIGLEQDLPEIPSVLNIKIARRTKNIMKGAAMTEDEALRAVKAGIRLAENEISRGARLIGLGETGVGNTTVAAAIVAACSGSPVSTLVGGGSCISEEIIIGETMIIERALAVNKPDSRDAFDVLTKLGGLEIAGLVGVILGAVKGGAAVVIDGAATSAAALLAVKMAPLAKDFLIGSLKTDEPCHQKALEMLDLRAYLDLNMHVGQGCGALLGMSLTKAAIHVLNDMKTFAETGVAVAQDGIGKSRQKSSLGCG